MKNVKSKQTVTVATKRRVAARSVDLHRVARLPRLDARSPLAKARDEWLESADGKACCDPLTLKAPSDARQYLENRLVGAWIAGAAWAERKQREGREPSESRSATAEGEE